MPWEERKLGAVTITAVPGLHDIYEIGFVVQGGGTSMYFAGDSRLHPVARARFVFGEQMARALPDVRCVVPQAGDLVPVRI